MTISHQVPSKQTPELAIKILCWHISRKRELATPPNALDNFAEQIRFQPSPFFLWIIYIHPVEKTGALAV